MDYKILTISIAAYNAEKYLAKCLDSLVNTSVADKLEVIIVNDGSTDHTKAIGEQYQADFPETVKLINKVNGGHGSTINSSIRSATAKYYKIVDADDWVETEGLGKLVEYLEGSNCDLVLNPYWEVSAITGEKVKTISPFSGSVPTKVELNFEQCKGFMPYMHSLTFRTEMVKKMGPIIDENCFYVDMEYALFPLEYVESVVYLDFPVYDYLLGNATQSMAIGNMIKRRDQHLKVTKRLVEYFVNRSNLLSSCKKEIFCNRAKYAIYNQYKIYYYMSSPEAKRELTDFDNWLRTYSYEIYEGPIGRFMRIIKFDRRTNWKFWRVSSFFVQKART